MRYEIRPMDENGKPTDKMLASSDDTNRADKLANYWGRFALTGVVIVDKTTGEIDIGFGFGVPSPTLDE